MELRITAIFAIAILVSTNATPREFEVGLYASEGDDRGLEFKDNVVAGWVEAPKPDYGSSKSEVVSVIREAGGSILDEREEKVIAVFSNKNMQSKSKFPSCHLVYFFEQESLSLGPKVVDQCAEIVGKFIPPNER